MKKALKKITQIALAVMIVFVLGLGSSLAKVAPDSISVKRAEVLSALVDNAEYGFTIFTTEDGQIIYCMDVDKTPLKQGQTASLSGNGDAGLLYILQNGYPVKSITGNDEADKYITQAAVWWYVNESKLSSDFKNATKETDRYQLVSKYIKPMVEKARQAKDTQGTPSLKIITNGTQLTLSDDEKYYESPYMSAALVNASEYKVSVSGGSKNTVIINEKGEKQTTFKSSERFKVRIPADEVTKTMNLSVKFTATGETQKAKIYTPSDKSYQRVVGLYTEEKALSGTASLKVDPKNPDNHVCAIIHDKYSGKDGNLVDEKTYKEECTVSEVVEVPNTKANISPFAVITGLLSILAGALLVICRKKSNILS